MIYTVASFTDAWIETTRKPGMSVEGKVASFTDAWIETVYAYRCPNQQGVASFTDAWIETATITFATTAGGSHLLQMRGLKLWVGTNHPPLYPSRIFYRCVD